MKSPIEEELSSAVGGSERRSKRRFAIEQDVQYKVLYARHFAEIGAGRTMNVSSGGIYFTTKTILPLGVRVELSMSWPVLLNDLCPMKLMIHGSVIRSAENGTAMAIERHEFRTRGRPMRTRSAPQVAGSTR